MERGVDLKALTAQVLQQALQEQGRGQKGLSKFIRVWQGELESGPPASSRGSSVPSWEVVDLGSEPAVSTPEKERSPPQIRIGEPGIFGQEDRKAGANEAKTTDFEDIARAIQSQTAELTSLVKNHTESTALPAGTLKGLNRQAEELVFLLRACNQYQVTIGAGEQGQALANALLSAQVGASTKLRKAGFKQKVTPRLAIGIAGPFWGSHEKYTLAASDFVPQTDAELDAFVQEIRSGKPGGDQRPAAPTKFEDWEARVRRQNDVWCLVYGLEWRRVRNHALELLTEWHQSEPHKWPLSVVSDIWEELHWRFFEELKEILRLLKKEAGRETMSLQDIKFHALLPNASGRAWLELPRTFDLKNPEGWFASEVMPRIERRQERVLWRLTWEGGRGSKPQGGAHAGGSQNPEKEDKPNLKSLWGPKLSTEEISRAKERAPVDKDGVLLCWGALTHMGCSNASCQRSHAGLQGRLEGLDPCVQMQFLRRGGLRRMKAETRESATDKIRNLRAGVAKDKAEKVASGRKSGQGEPAETADGGATRAGGEKVVRIWDVPEEFEAVDFTQAESDMRETLQGPDSGWLREPVGHVEHLIEADGETAPFEAKALVARAKEMKDGPVLSQLVEASDARVANEPEATLEDILGDMATYGIGELAAEAADILEKVIGKKAGASVAVHVGDTTWEPGCPGRAVATIQGTEWTVWDYREEVHMTEELAAILRQADEGVERRQCVVKTIAAGLVWRKLARQPSLAEAEDCARAVRLEQARQALEAQAVMGEPDHRVAPIEAELRVYAHDILKANHDKDFRSHAVFPVVDMDECKLVVVRANYKGEVVAETVTGSAWQEGGWVMWAVIWRGHMMLLEPPHNLDVAGTLEAWNPHDTPALGFSFFWHTRHDEPRTAPGQVACRLCKPARKAGDLGHAALQPRRDSSLAAAAIVGCIKAGSVRPGDPRRLRGDSLCFQEVFAGKAVMSDAWLNAGVPCMEPIEVYIDPHEKTGYVKDFDLMLPEVQRHWLREVRRGRANVWWIAAPCTSFCDWSLQNGGTRSFASPLGGANGQPLKEVEMVGNTLGNVAAELFLSALETGAFPVAESTAKSGRYPKMWDLPSWQAILARPDVQFVEFPMCAFGLGPGDGSGFYHHKTRVVFPTCPELAAALARRCPGVGGTHQHIPLKGSRDGSRATRCTEAGVYARDFVDTVAAVLSQALCGGGGASTSYEPQLQGDSRPSGAGAEAGEQDCVDPSSFSAGSVQSAHGREQDRVDPGSFNAGSVQSAHGREQGRVDPCSFNAGSVQSAHGREQDRGGPSFRAGSNNHSRAGSHESYHGMGEVAGVVPWLDDIFDDEDYESSGVPVSGFVLKGDDLDVTKAGSAAKPYKAPNQKAKQAAETYVAKVQASEAGDPAAWGQVVECGAVLLDGAGSVQGAAESLWQVREEQGLNNLAGVDDPYLDTVLHPHLLEYLRDVRHRGMAARCVGERRRLKARPHPNARRHLDQLYKQIWKDVVKHRVLVVPSDHPAMHDVLSSPFNADVTRSDNCGGQADSP